MFLQMVLQRDKELMLYIQIQHVPQKRIVPTLGCIAQQSNLATVNKLLFDVCQPLNVLTDFRYKLACDG